jgi:hypothetical protein
VYRHFASWIYPAVARISPPIGTSQADLKPIPDDRTSSSAWRSACQQKADHPGYRRVMRHVTLAGDTPR